MPKPRNFPDWLTAFVEGAQFGEAPLYMYFWVGVSTIAAALRRQVWVDMGTFTWYPNLYTLMVAPPGVVAKSSTADLGMRLLKQVPGIRFGPATLTWQSLYDAFAECGEEFEVEGVMLKQFPLVINSSEFGITLNPRDTEMIDQLVHIWDGREMSKRTRKDGELIISDPCLNMIACTTPSWIAENVPQYLIGGGLTSRMLFVYAEEKSKYVAYPSRVIPKDYAERTAKLVEDLDAIAQLRGKFTLTEEAMDWGEQWYENFLKTESKLLDPTILGGYIARKQTLTHKVAMCLSVSMGDNLIIDRTLLERSVALVTELEKQMPMVYSKIGMTKEASVGETILAFIDRCKGEAPFQALYRYVHKTVPNPRDFELIIEGLIDAGRITINKNTGVIRRLS